MRFLHNALSRRGAGLLLLSGVLLPRQTRAQEPPVPNVQPLPPTQPIAPAVPPPRPVPPQVPGPIDRTKHYYVFFDQNIDVASMRALRRQLSSLVEAGVPEITIVLSSAGGLLTPMLLTYSFIRALPAKVNTHAQGSVMSAASALFLAGEDRSADRNAWFMFHPAQYPFAGQLNEQQLHEGLEQIDAVGASLTQIYLDRTKMTQADIDRFGHEEAIYTADQAQSLGIVQTVADLKIPGDGKAKILFLD